jgi:glycosyltransferase involved in cell wall biosynthesis
MKLSVVIPTWNEAAWLPRVLRGLSTGPRPQEIIVSDNYSSDATRSVAVAYGATVVDGGRPAVGRNAGARASSGDTLLFLDADVFVPRPTLEKAFRTLQHTDTVAVHVRTDPMCTDPFVRACYSTMHWYFRVLSWFRYPQGLGCFAMVRRSAFQSIGGFAEDLDVGEDADFFRRLRRAGRVVYLSSCSVLVSTRRFRRERPVIYAVKCILWAALRLLGSRRCVLGYQWKTHPSSEASIEELR